MAKELTSEQRKQIEAAIEELERLGPGAAADGATWARIRDAGLLLAASMNGRPPSLQELKLIQAAEKIAAWHPAPVRLVDLAADEATRREVEAWITRVRAAEQAMTEAEAALNAARAKVIAELRDRGEFFLLISEQRAEQKGLRELQSAAVKARVAFNALQQAFSDWRLRAYCAGRLRATNGTW